MGRIGAAALLLLGTACGDNVGGDLPPGQGDGPNEAGSVTARYEPEVCGVIAWSPTSGVDAAQDLSVAARADGGATVLTAPLSGGTVYGFQVDPRMNMEGNAVSKLPLDNTTTFDKVTVSYIQERPVSVALSGGAAFIHMLNDTLTTAEFITKIPATAVADPTFYKAQGNLVMPVGTADGLMMYKFDDSMEPQGAKLFKSTKPVLSVTSAQLQTNMMTAWSTETECHLMINTTFEPGISTRVNAPCVDPRISVNESTGEAVLLFDSIEGIRMMPIHLTKFGNDAPVLRAHASSPRTLFDGQRHWISYLDARGDVVVGFLDENLKPVTISLGAPQPERAAFELVMMKDGPTVFSLDEGGYTAYRMCTKAIE